MSPRTAIATRPDVEPAPPAPVLTASLVVSFMPDGSMWVPADGVAGAVGGGFDFVVNRAQAHKVPIARDAEGTFGFAIADAARLILTLRAELDEHESKWRSYVAYREAKKREAAERQVAEATAAREAERQRQVAMAKRMSEEQERRDQAEAALKAAERAKVHGAPVEFDRWQAGVS